MDDLSAIQYEFTIRKAHQVGRYGAAGADANAFIVLEKMYKEYISFDENQDPDTSEKLRSKIELAIAYGVELGRVGTYLNMAINEVLNKQKNRLNEKHLNELQRLKLLLDNPSVDKIKQVVPEFQDVMNTIGVKL